jgi:pyridinium-3,5-biscarboxylic acid mononucleotide sulfurtransferase
MELDEKLEKLKDYLKNRRVLIAFSGGADSSLIAAIASEISAEAVAVTVDNGVMPVDCMGNAGKIADSIGIKHMIVKENFLQDESFRSNPPNRCYICKNKMYSKLSEIAEQEKLELVDGTNITDLLEDRPGIMVNYNKNIKSPLVKSGFTAEDVRNTLQMFKIDYSKSTTCLATRISKNNEITTKKINRISYAESLLKGLSGSEVLRVRDQDGVALIEVENIEKMLNKGVLSHLDSELKAVGFKRVTIDIGTLGDSKKDIVVYKPCKDEKHKIMFETELPYTINMAETCEELKKLGEVKCSIEMGIAMLEVEGKNVTIFKAGKIVARRVRDKEDAENLLIQVLPSLRRNIK